MCLKYPMKRIPCTTICYDKKIGWFIRPDLSRWSVDNFTACVFTPDQYTGELSMCICPLIKGFMLLTSDIYLCSIASQAVREGRQQESHALELPLQRVLNLSWMDPDLTLQVGPFLWALPLLLHLDYHARPRGHPGASPGPVLTLSWVKVLGVHRVSLTRIYIVFKNRMFSPHRLLSV